MIENGLPNGAELADDGSLTDTDGNLLLGPDIEFWTTTTLQRDYCVESFLAPMVFVSRKSDGVSGTLDFNHRPRFYFNFQPTRGAS